MKSYHRGYVSIDLDAIEENITNIKRNISADAEMMLVIKADAYGHGAARIAKEFECEKGIWGFGVASLEEAMILRKEGIKNKILVLGVVYPDQYADLIRERISATVFTDECAREISKTAKNMEIPASIHIKIDTGMSRLGAKSDIDAVKWIETLVQDNWLQLEGVSTHFATADEKDQTFIIEQHKKFKYVMDELNSRNIQVSNYHCANSATAITYPEYSYNLIRIGISQYGLYPSDDVNKNTLLLSPALSWHSVVSNIRYIQKGDTVSYGRAYQAKNDMCIATIPVGYADGYPRSLSNKGYVLINGMKARILGKVCMDQFMVDVTNIVGVEFMSPVVLVGRDGDSKIFIEELSQLSDKFNYEFVCGISKRMPRNYVKDGRIMDQIDYFA